MEIIAVSLDWRSYVLYEITTEFYQDANPDTKQMLY